MSTPTNNRPDLELIAWLVEMMRSRVRAECGFDEQTEKGSPQHIAAAAAEAALNSVAAIFRARTPAEAAWYAFVFSVHSPGLDYAHIEGDNFMDLSYGPREGDQR